MTFNWEAFTKDTVTSAEVRLLGTVDVPSVLALQKLMVHEVRQQSRISAAVLICEHPPAISVGTDGNLLELPEDRRELESKLLAVHKVKRDGHAVLHQRGQLAAYVIVSLHECEYGEQEFRWRLQEAMIRTCRDSQVNIQRDANDPTALFGRHGAVCEIGILVDNAVTCFGSFLNVACCLNEARQYGRGLLGQRVSSLSAERVRPAIMPQVRTSLIHHICEQIGYPEYHVHTGHPFLKRTRKLIHDKFADH
ncbi:MAG: hypothetical protein R3C19_12290 [Planctomycetaceae bacterium]